MGGGSGNESLFSYIAHELSQSYCVFAISEEGAECFGCGYEIALIQTYSPCRICIPGSLAVICGDYTQKAEFAPTVTVIVNSLNQTQTGYLKESPCRVITCGYGEKDTFTYSSLTDDSVMIALNREISAMSGKIIQPLELPAPLDHRSGSVYPVIAYTALRLLLDDCDPEIRKLY